MSVKRCYYEVLSVSRSVDGQELKKAFRKLALEYHPDRNPGDESAIEKFREAQEAYEVLSDQNKRSLYDQFGHDGLKGQMGGGGFGGMEDVFEGFGSIFEDFFGGGRAQARGRDLRFRMDIEFREAILGCTKTIQLKRRETCEPCDGSGSKPGHQAETCSMCQGHGKVRRQQGFFVMQQTCPQCRGEGQNITHPCDSCDGLGLLEKDVELEVNVPAGVDTGLRLRLSQEGEAISKGVRGDLFVEIQVAADEVFERDGADLYIKKHISYKDAVLGGKIEIPLIEGTKMIRVPSGLKTPHVEIVRNQGVADIRTGQRGHLVVEIHIETPKKLSKKAKKLLEELQEELAAS